ncbi:TadG family pilus assembly protein [Chelativorans multitrophicus]|jgi:uncharacterized membrane protein|uniref:Uncharacterized protein n=2 Tax=Chelativorans TaxID=449972 RepID=Q11IN6_CHESB|nr:TadG family pilus assembly protein [Chelativorans multitrophicus]
MMARIAGRAVQALRDRSGNVAVMAGLLFPVMLLGAVFGVDQGSLYLERREAQALTDLAAVTAVANISRANAAAALTMADNRQGNVQLIDRATLSTPMAAGTGAQMLVEPGRYSADPSTESPWRFTPGAEPANAVRVTFRKKGKLYFGAGFFEPPVITTTGIAAARAEAAFSIGSRLLSANTETSILNPVLGELLGVKLNLKLMDYEALANADIQALTFLEELATEIGLTAGTYDDVLAAEVTLGQVLRAVAASTSHSAARQFVLQLASGTRTGSLKVPLSYLLDLGNLGRLAIGEQAPGIEAVIGILDLVSAATAVANRNEQVNVQLGAFLNVAGASVKIAIGEPPLNTPWFAVGEAGTLVRTAQTRLYLELSVSLPGLANAKLPLYLELAFAEAKLREVTCSPGGVSRVAIDARPGILEAWIGQVDPSQLKRFDRKPTVQEVQLATVNLPLLPTIAVKGRAHLQTADETAQTLIFDKREIEGRVLKTAYSTTLAGPLFSSLLGNLKFNTEPKILGGVIDPVLTGLSQTLAGFGSVIDPILFNVLTALGVRLGEADIRVNGASCSRATLVN